MTEADGSEVTEAIESAAVRPAGFWIRAAARTIDMVVILAGFVIGFVSLAFNTGFFVSVTRTKAQPTWIEHLNLGTWVALAGLLVAFATYHAIAEGVVGTTLGKRAVGLRVVTVELQPPSFRAAVVRSLGFFLDSFFFALVAAYAMYRSPMRQRHGDFWARTYVVHQSSLGHLSWPRRGLLGGVIVAAMLAAGWAGTTGVYLSSVFLPKR